MTIIENIIEEEEEIDEKMEDYEEFVEYADEGDVLIIRRSLHANLGDEEPWLRNNIFQTRCIASSKVYNVIIDGGICTNVMTEEMVTKLNMKIEPHP